MTARFVRKFDNYEAATRWCHAHNYTPAITFVGHTNACTVTLEGEDAQRAIEADAKAKAQTILSEGAYT